MKKEAQRSGERFLYICPFCEAYVDVMTYLKWCGQCGCEWYHNRNGDVIFDTNRKTPRFAWGKAVQKSGGIKIGGKGE